MAGAAGSKVTQQSKYTTMNTTTTILLLVLLILMSYCSVFKGGLGSVHTGLPHRAPAPPSGSSSVHTGAFISQAQHDGVS